VNESDSKGSFYNKFANSDLFEDDEVDDDDDETKPLNPQVLMPNCTSHIDTESCGAFEV
jgi:hypothetical protein